MLFGLNNQKTIFGKRNYQKKTITINTSKPQVTSITAIDLATSPKSQQYQHPFKTLHFKGSHKEGLMQFYLQRRETSFAL